MMNRILVAMFASAFLACPAVAGWASVQLMMAAGFTPGAVFCAFLGLAFGSAWVDIFSKNYERSIRAGWFCFASTIFFFLSYCFSHWQLTVDNILMN